jgi:ribosomal protein L11 methyltransferase
LRPSFVPWESRPGQRCLLIDPGQAFGTGAHASTWLALKTLDALAPTSLQGRAVLDVGCGTGVLALAALALGARYALGFDLDPLATEAARENAACNGFVAQASFFTGPIEAVRNEIPFDGVLANLLRSEVVPLIPEIVRCVAHGGWVIFSGLIEPDLPEVERALREVGLEIEGRVEQRDANGECWVALRARRED